MANEIIDYEYICYKALWALADIYYNKYIENGLDDVIADRMADEEVCNVLDITLQEYADIIEAF